MHLHETEVPVMLEGAIVPVGYRVTTKDFDFTAIYETDGTVNVYVEWGDDQPGDMSNHDSMADAKRWLDTLLKSTEPKVEPKKIDLISVLNESVDAALKKNSIRNTPANRVDTLMGMHKRIANQPTVAPDDRVILQAIEDEVVRLQDQS